MGSFVVHGLVWVALAHAGIMGAATLGELASAAERLRTDWREERAFRACLGVIQLQWNVDAAATHLGHVIPERAVDVVMAAESIDGDLEAFLPDGRADCISLGAPLGLTFERHLERHPGQPEAWPNWTARWRQSR